MLELANYLNGLLKIILSSLLIIPLTIQENSYLGSNCVFSKGNYTVNSPFHSNLLVAFSKLTFLPNTTFSNITVGSGPDQVFAFYDCRNDITLLACHHCIEDATETLLQLCPNSKEAIVSYEECMLRYANRSIFSTMDLVPAYTSCGTKAPEGGMLKRTLGPVLQGLIDEATSDDSPQYFSIGNASYYEYQRVYCLVQCTPDISRTECNECLMDAMNFTIQCAGESRLAGIVSGPSCQMRYDIVPFFNSSSRLPPSASPDPAPLINPSTHVARTGNGGPPSLSSTVKISSLFLYSFYLWI